MLRRILIIAGYSLLTILVVALTVGLVAYGKDYTYDFKTHRIVQKGHVIIKSVPNNLELVADGKWLHKKTPYQAAYSVGAHTFSLALDGFWTWQKTLNVVAGEVSLAQYVILVPKHPATTVLDTKPQIVAQSISKDHRHLAYATGGADQALYTLDVGNPKPVRLYVPKAATATVGAEVLTGVTWSDDASHLLLMSTVDGAPVAQVMAANGSDLRNLTDQYKFDFSTLKFSSSDWRLLYWVSPDGMRRLDLGAQTVSAVLADKVTQIWIVPGRVLYVQQTELGRSLWSMDSHDKHQELIPALPESDSYQVAYATYLNQDELAVVPAGTQTGTLYSDIFSDTPVAKTIAHGVTGVSFSADGHLAAFTAPTKISVYDLERSQIHNTFVRYDITGQPGTLSALTWFDNYHLLVTRSGQLYWCEFDGTNRVPLGASAGAWPAFATATADNAKALVSFVPGTGVAPSVMITQLQIRP
jgi:hypothetical protein